ncbi:hypothetical protein PVK06_024093 [Gossypium arboreum]|uniref:Uncharacterized protein n=1 Tax=Gossypium arboreum TaxID=29729 RepID=A0ABR0PD82_GOSAR|nr:hypothetical protein PVK06_024093 [Gossypium arboreum]
MIMFFCEFEVDYVLLNPPIVEEARDTDTIPGDSGIDATTKAKYEKCNKMVRGHMLSHMANNLFDLFVKDKLAKYI